MGPLGIKWLINGLCIAKSLFKYCIMDFHEVQIFTNADFSGLSRNFHDSEIHDPELT